MNDNFYVNFYDKKLSLYINGFHCAQRTVTVLERGMPENKERYPVGKDAHSMLTDTFGLHYDRLLFKHMPYYEDWGYGWTTAGFHSIAPNGVLFERDIKDMTLKIEYAPCRESVSMKELLDYPADLVIEYLKERGITSCPLITE